MPKTMGMNSSAASGMQTAIFSMMRRTVVLAAAPLTNCTNVQNIPPTAMMVQNQKAVM